MTTEKLKELNELDSQINKYTSLLQNIQNLHYAIGKHSDNTTELTFYCGFNNGPQTGFIPVDVRTLEAIMNILFTYYDKKLAVAQEKFQSL